jgi:hypothetical protein
MEDFLEAKILPVFFAQRDATLQRENNPAA